MRRKIVMLGTSPESRGGIAAVVQVYRRAGLFQDWPILYLASHRDGSLPTKLGAALAAICRFVILVLRRRVSLLHVLGASRGSFWRKSLFMLLARIARVPVIFHLHGGGFRRFYENECGALGRRAVRFTLDGADRILVLSESWRQQLRRMTRNAEISVMVNPVEPWAGPIVERQASRLLFLGRLEREKGLYELLEAISPLRAELPGIRLIAAGEGQDEELDAELRRLGLEESVELPGWLDRERKIEELSRSSLFVLPSYNEGLPMALLEAMAAGLAVVATEVGGIPELIEDGINGRLVAPGDVAGLRGAIGGLLGDSAARERLGRAAAARVDACYAADRVMARIGEIYSEFGQHPARTMRRPQ